MSNTFSWRKRPFHHLKYMAVVYCRKSMDAYYISSYIHYLLTVIIQNGLQDVKM